MCRSAGSIARRHPRPPHPTGLLRPCHCARPPSTHGQPESGLADATGLPDVAITPSDTSMVMANTMPIILGPFRTTLDYTAMKRINRQY